MDFNDFWALYPRKTAKKYAQTAWDRIAKKYHKDIIEDLKKRKWDDPRFIPYPATYLNGQRWLDEKPAVPLKDAPEPRPVQRLPRSEHRTPRASEYLENLKKLYGR